MQPSDAADDHVLNTGSRASEVLAEVADHPAIELCFP
jgi:hypothetical protein